MSMTLQSQSPILVNEVSGSSDQRTLRSMALRDIATALTQWRLWGRLGWNDILQRYRRSALGPFWLTASMSVMVLSLGVLYATLFNTPINDFLPFLCVGLLLWSLISTFLTEGGTLFTGSESYIKQVRLPYSIYVFRATWSKVIIFAHNFLIYFAVILYFGINPGWVALLALPGFIIVVLNGALATLFIGMISARFRDIPPLVNSVVQIIFFVTPITWKPELLRHHAYLVHYNPFHAMIDVVRAPLLGTMPAAMDYAVLAGVTLVNLIVVGLFFSAFRSRISYWV